jgi:hypothetical protein
MPEGTNNMNGKPLSKDNRLRIRDIWLKNFNKKSVPHVEDAWFEVICTFLRYEGHDIVPEEVRLLESLVIDRGLSEDYIEALISITKPTSDLEEAEQIVHFLSASPEERLQALRFVLAV